MEPSFYGGVFVGQQFYHHAHSHSRGEPVGVEDDVGHHPRLSEGHVLAVVQTTADALLTRTTRVLVACKTNQSKLNSTFAYPMGMFLLDHMKNL